MAMSKPVWIYGVYTWDRGENTSVNTLTLNYAEARDLAQAKSLPPGVFAYVVRWELEVENSRTLMVEYRKGEEITNYEKRQAARLPRRLPENNKVIDVTALRRAEEARRNRAV